MNVFFFPVALPKLWQAWSGWREVMRKLRDVLEDQDATSRPMQVVRPMVGVGINIGLMLYGILDDPNFYYFILIVCLVNMGVYFANYVVAKVVCCILLWHSLTLFIFPVVCSCRLKLVCLLKWLALPSDSVT